MKNNICFICGSNIRDFELDGRYKICPVCGVIAKTGRGISDLVNDKPVNELVEIDRARNSIHSFVLKQIEREFPEKGKMLDIGCGLGSLLGMAERSGWDTAGIEMCPQCAGYAKENKVNIYSCSLDGKKFPDKHFDVVTLVNVLDFTEDPLILLKEVDRILRPGGAVFIRIPNTVVQMKLRVFYQRIGSRVGTKKIGEFFNYSFTPKSMRMLLEKVGFVNVSIRNSAMSKGDVYNYNIPLMAFMKMVYGILSEVIFYLSFGKVLMSSSLLASAKKL
ncbi:MAG: class I SAM-dependent methyltransferase [Candidatus Omnitrophota bacterium]